MDEQLQYTFHSPKRAGNGAALQVDTFLGKTTKDNPKIVCTISIAPQTGTNQQGNATFGWKDSKKSCAVNLEEIAHLICWLDTGMSKSVTQVFKVERVSFVHKYKDTTTFLHGVWSQIKSQVTDQQGNQVEQITFRPTITIGHSKQDHVSFTFNLERAYAFRCLLYEAMKKMMVNIRFQQQQQQGSQAGDDSGFDPSTFGDGPDMGTAGGGAGFQSGNAPDEGGFSGDFGAAPTAGALGE